MSVCPSPRQSYERSPDADVERLDDELILLHRKTLQVRVLNCTASVLWDALELYHTAPELAGLMREAWPTMPEADSLDFARQFLTSLAEAGFVIARELPSEAGVPA